MDMYVIGQMARVFVHAFMDVIYRCLLGPSGGEANTMCHFGEGCV